MMFFTFITQAQNNTFLLKYDKLIMQPRGFQLND